MTSQQWRDRFAIRLSKFLFPEGSGAGISTPSASADPLLAGAGTAASAVVGCSRERARAASSALADIVAGSRCLPRDVFAAARPLLLARKEERCVGARSRSTSVHSNNSLCSEIGRLVNPPIPRSVSRKSKGGKIAFRLSENWTMWRVPWSRSRAPPVYGRSARAAPYHPGTTKACAGAFRPSPVAAAGWKRAGF